MSFKEFLAAIDESRLAAVARHWDAVRRDRVMPCWRDIDPAAISRELPIVWAWRWDPATGAFVGRLAGDEVERNFGGSIRGRTVAEAFDPKQAEIVTRHFLQAVHSPVLIRSAGQAYSSKDLSGFVERIIMPLGPDHNDAGGVIGATLYRFETALCRPQGEDAIWQLFSIE